MKPLARLLHWLVIFSLALLPGLAPAVASGNGAFGVSGLYAPCVVFL